MRSQYCRLRFNELTSGVDALYLSGRVDLPADLLDRLEQGREAAAAAGGSVPFAFGGYDWQIYPHGRGSYRFLLGHEAGSLAVTASEKFPSFRFQATAEVLHSSVGPSGVARWIDLACRNEDLVVAWSVSRIDLQVDVQGWRITGDDRHRFVCRAKARTTHEDDGRLTGFRFGQRSSKTINGRIYDKTLQIERKGADWWFEKWGSRRRPEEPVLRVEFEYHRGVLSEMGLITPAETLENVAGLWAYATQQWLTYRSPSDHERISRWPVSPEWSRLQRSKLAGTALPLARIRAGTDAGDLRRILPALTGYMATFGAITGRTDVDDVCQALPAIVRSYEQQSGQAFCDRVAEKDQRRRA